MMNVKKIYKEQKQFDEERKDLRDFLSLKIAKKMVGKFIKEANEDIEKAFDLVVDELIKLGEIEFFKEFQILGREDFFKICDELGYKKKEEKINKLTRKYEGTVKLKGLGVLDGIKAKNLRVGDVILGDDGKAEEIKKIRFTETKKTIILTVESNNWYDFEEKYEKRLRVDTIVAITKELTDTRSEEEKELAISYIESYLEKAKGDVELAKDMYLDYIEINGKEDTFFITCIMDMSEFDAIAKDYEYKEDDKIESEICGSEKIKKREGKLEMIDIEKNQKTITEDRKEILKNSLINDQDKFLIECLWCGLYGEKLSEIINLKLSDIDFENKTIKGINKKLILTDDFFELAQKANSQKYYYKQNAEDYSSVDFELVESEYIFKIRPLPKNNYGKDAPSYDAMRARMTKIARLAKEIFLNNENKFTAKDIYHAGIVDRLIEESHKWTIEGIEKKLKKEGYNCLAFRIKKLLETTLTEK